MSRESTNPSSNTPYLIAVAFLALLTVLAIVLITFLRPDKDNTALITAVIGALVPTTASILALMKAQETHLSVNSRLDAFIETEAKLSRLEGIHAGVAAEQARMGILTELAEARMAARLASLPESPPAAPAAPSAE